MNYLQCQFEPLDGEREEQLIAMLAEAGFTGFEETEKGLKAFIPESDWDPGVLDLILEQISVKYSKSIIEEKNWNAKWEAGFEPVLIPHPESGEPWVRIRAHFHDPDPHYAMELEVTPKMSFGTGHHATTYLVIQQMGRMDWKNQTVIDFGTGTGVLAILAEKLGAKEILAIDYDPWCMENAAENLVANHCTRIRLKQADSLQQETGTVDVILANINLNIIRDNLADISRLLKPDAEVLFSGLLVSDEALLNAELESFGLQKKQVFQKNGWIMIRATRMVGLSTI